MNLFRNPVKMSSLILLSAILMLTASCSKDDNDSPSYPRTVEVKYRVTKISGTLNDITILYTNQSGGRTGLSNQTLPYTVAFDREVEQYDDLAVSIAAYGNASVKLEILVNDRVVESETYTDDSYVSGSIVYLFQ